MATKRETPVKRRAKKKVVDPQSAAIRVDEDPEMRRRLIAMEAYYLAERRGFVAGHEEEDWIAAEAVVRSRTAANPD